MSVGMFAAGMVTGRLARRFGPKATVVAGAVLTVVPLAMLAFSDHRAWEVYVASGLLGLAVGWVYAATAAIVVEAVPQEQTGAASGVNANLRTIGGSVGSSLMATIVAAGLVANRLPSGQAYTRGFLALMVVAAVACVTSLLIPAATRSRVSLPVRVADGPIVDLEAV
jgi:MFS family permease